VSSVWAHANMQLSSADDTNTRTVRTKSPSATDVLMRYGDHMTSLTSI
jgi:hypothetical protein